MNFDNENIEEYDEMLGELIGRLSYSYEPKNFDPNLKNSATPLAWPSTEEPPVLELKALILICIMLS